MEIPLDEFGVVIAYVLPGAVGMIGVAFWSETLSSWLRKDGGSGPSIGAALLFVMGALMIGLVSEAIREALLWPVLWWMGGAEWTHKDLIGDKLAAFQGILNGHYRFHQFYANSTICLLASYVSLRFSPIPEPKYLRRALVCCLLILMCGAWMQLSAYSRAIADITNP